MTDLHTGSPAVLLKVSDREDGNIVASSSSSDSNYSHSQDSQSSQAILCNIREEDPKRPVVDAESNSSAETEEDHGSQGKEYFCGIGRWKPKWLQVFRNAKFFTFILCLNCLVEGSLVSGFTSVVLSSIERRYRFPSVLAGLIATMFDIAVLVSVLFISYAGGRGHKPRWLGVSLFIQGAGAFVFSLPQFIFGLYGGGQGANRFESCDAESDFSPDCNTPINLALLFFFVGNILVGVGAAPLFTIGTAYLDDIVHPKYVTIHLGLMYASAVVGPAIGYGLGGVFLSIYVDPLIPTTLNISDPGWVGAWWICFIFTGILSWILAVPFLMFPRYLPDTHHVKAERLKEMAQKYDGKDSLEGVDFAVKVKTFPRHLKQVILTPSWIFITIAICFSTLIVSGVTSFAPKYLESQFSIPASQASLIAGAIAIPGGGVGVFVGALIIFITKSKGRRVALINWVVTLLALFPTFIFFVHCPTIELVGVTVEYPDGSVVPTSVSTFNSTCIQDCKCNSTIFEPVCGEDGNTYFSPCRAGCQKTYINNDLTQPIFENCTCIAMNMEKKYGNDQYNIEWSGNATAVDGTCPHFCNKMGIFLGIIFITLFLIFILQVPNIVITVRCVADEQRTLALGAQSVAFRAFGSIPGPLVFGGIFDSVCIYWQYQCNRRGNCWLYNNVHLSERAVTVAMLGIGVNFIFSVLSWLCYPKETALEKTKNKVDVPLGDIKSSMNEDNSDGGVD